MTFSKISCVAPIAISNSQFSDLPVLDLSAALDGLIIPSFLKPFLHLVSRTPFSLLLPEPQWQLLSLFIAFPFHLIFSSSKHYKVPSDLFPLLYLFPHDLIQTHAFKYHLYADGSKIYIFSSDLLPDLPSSLDSHLPMGYLIGILKFTGSKTDHLIAQFHSCSFYHLINLSPIPFTFFSESTKMMSL